MTNTTRSDPAQVGSTPQDASGAYPRPDRFTSHALVEIKKFRHLPFFTKSAVLLDISLGGFKVEFTGEVRSRPGDQFWLSIPLNPLGIFAPTRLAVRGETRWFDDKRCRIGGVFTSMTETDRLIIDQVIDSLRKRGFLL